ncbi:MAG: thioesterase family protein, partial [Chloroflexota bacterium]
TRESEVEFLTPVAFRDMVHVTTWVTDFRRVRSLRLYDFHINDNPKPAARAWTDWVYARKDSGMPAIVPNEVAEKFLAENGGENRVERSKFPKMPTYAPELGNVPLKPEWRDLDPNGHINNASWLSYIENGTIEFCESIDWPTDRMASEGFGIFARKYRIEYHKAAGLNDRFYLKTWVSDRRRATAIRNHEIRHADDDSLLVRARCLYVWVNLKTGAPIKIPAHFLDDFAHNFSPD